MSVEDKTIAMRVRKGIVRSSLDISELQVGCIRGVVELTGKVKRPHNYSGEMSVRKEFDKLLETARSTLGVRDVMADRVQKIE